MKLFSAFAVLGAILLAAPAFAAHDRNSDEFFNVDVQGTLHSSDGGRRATLEVNGQKFELNLGGTRSLERAADRFDRRLVRVTGTLHSYNARNRDFPNFEINVDRIERGGDRSENVRYERRPVVREKVYVEKDDPIIKLPFVEIND